MHTDSMTAGGMVLCPGRVQVGASSLIVSVSPLTVPHMADPTTSLVNSRTCSGLDEQKNQPGISQTRCHALERLGIRGSGIPVN